MRKGYFIWILMLLGVILGIAVIDSSVRRPIDWRRTFKIRDKLPYGKFVLFNELPQIMGKDRKIKDFGWTFYEEITRLDTAKNYSAAIMQIDNDVYFHKEDVEKILHYADQGGEIFLSGQYFNGQLMDTLGIAAQALDYDKFYPTDNRVTYSLVGDTTKIKVKKVTAFTVFSKLNPKNCVVLGYIHARGRAMPNFIKVSVGKGYIYMHGLPDVFANYHLLEENTYNYASKVLNVIQHKEIFLWDIYFSMELPRTPLRVILTQPGFYQAWYLLLLGLIILLIFKSKREQRAVKVMLPEQNLSKEFAKTIGNMYYENGSPGNIIHKKIDYFLFSIRSAFHLDTLDILNEKFIKQLSLKAGVDYEETKSLMKLVDHYKRAGYHHIDDVKQINVAIEDFKQKANII